MFASKDYFIEINHSIKFKHGYVVGGDTFITRKLKDSNRIVSVLSDGLGSGIKASVLSTLTSSMIIEYASANRDLSKDAVTIMKTLPVDQVRKISYSTFTIVDLDHHGNCKIMEYDNPAFILLRDGEIVDIKKKIIQGDLDSIREYELFFSEFKMLVGDRLIIFSDGVTQSGMGTPRFPFGWGNDAVQDFVKYLQANVSTISARGMSNEIVNHAYANANYKAKDDITCAVFYVREPRKLLILTGPPVDKEKDKILAEYVTDHEGKIVICGGTTTQIVSRELKRKAVVDIETLDPDIPCTSKMEGVDLVTEGMLTLGKVMELLEKDLPNNEMNKINGAIKLLNLILETDEIEFIVGTKINEVHQDPNMPFELGIRRNTIKSLARILDEKYLKDIKIKYI